MSKIKRIVTKFLLSFFVFLVVIFSFAPLATVHAQSWYSELPSDWYVKVYDTNNPSEIFGERYTAAQVEWVIYTVLFWLPTKIVGPKVMSCGLSIVFGGGDISSCVEALFTSSSLKIQPVASTNESLLSAIFEERPISAITYFKDIARKFKLIPEAQAQGFGFQYALNPILFMWKTSRNVAYSLLILVTIALAFMIMFRVKISPQVVISVQSAIPKLVIALILITFSYAIAGFLIDLMYVVIGLVSLLSKGFLPGDLPSTTIFNFLTKGQPFALNVQLGAIGLIVLYLVFFGVLFSLSLFSVVGMIASSGTALGAIAVIGVGVATGGGFLVILLVLALLIFAIILIALLIFTIKILWMLLKAYATVLLLTIFAPFQILLGVISPNFGFGSWLKSYISNLSTFIVTGVLFLLAFSFIFLGTAISFAPIQGVDTIVLALLGSRLTGLYSNLTNTTSASWPPLLGGSQNMIGLLFFGVSFVIFTIIPKAADMIQAFIAGKPFAYGTAIGEFAGAPGRALGLGFRGVSIATDIGRAASTRFGTRGYPSPETGKPSANVRPEGGRPASEEMPLPS